jgi:aspartate/methionine/tyrosine aminotransferase
MSSALSRVVRAVPPSKIREMFTAAEAYPQAISLGIGEPDFPTPEPVVRAALADALAGHTHYTASQGDPELRAALAAHLSPRYGVELGPEDILVTTGGMGALTAFFRAVCDPGDEVILPEPHFPAYRAMIEFVGGKVVYAHTRLEDGFVLRPEAVEAALGPRSKVLLLNSPNNPTGAMIPPATLDRLAELALAHDLVVVSDEVYDRIVFGEVPHQSIYTRPGMAQRTCVVGSFSKGFAMTGWRLGWAFGPRWLLEGMLKVATFYTSCPSSVSQRAALAALAQPASTYDRMVEAFRRRRDMAVAMLREVPGVRVEPPPGSFYLFPDLGEICDDTERFAQQLLQREQVVVIPGGAFGPSGERCIRLALTVGEARLQEALTRLRRFARAW